MIRDRVPAYIGLLWLGMIVGVSFVATPIKFQAPSVTLEIGLDIGRLTFGIFNKIEIVFAVLLAVAVILAKRRDKSFVVLGVVWLALALQTIWLLPALIDRIQIVLEGYSLLPSALHSMYVGLEALKALALGVYGYQNIYQSSRPGTNV